jgi:hypothetical protein
MSASDTTPSNLSSTTPQQQTYPAADAGTTKRIVFTTTFFAQSKTTQTMYLLEKDSPQGRILQRHRSEWSQEECIRFVQENATSTRPYYIDWCNREVRKHTPQPPS